MKKLICMSAVLLSLVGCATSYQNVGVTGGFETSQLSIDTWKINFAGNGHTRQARAEDMVLLKSSDLAVNSGYRYFVNIEVNATYSSNGEYPNLTRVVKMYKTQPETGRNVYDAFFICSSLGPKYNVDCSKKNN